MLKPIVQIAITYVYFLIFAQFAFLEHVKNQVGLRLLQPTMAIMGISGLAVSLLLGINWHRLSKINVIRWGFILCCFSSVLSILSRNEIFLLISSCSIGIGLGTLTVSLATSLVIYAREEPKTKHIGLICGVGTGVAYFICNIPLIFQASCISQAFFSAILCLCGIVITDRSILDVESLAHVERKICKYTLLGQSFGWYLCICLILVWFDSAAFFVIQQARELKSLTWLGESRLWYNAICHLLFALIAGFLVMKKSISICLGTSFVLLSIAIFYLQLIPQYHHYSGFLYCAGVSMYSTVLVALPSILEQNDSVSRARRAAMTYGIAGWIGSAMGIGMAQDLQRIPYTFIIIGGISILFCNLKLQKSSALFALSVIILYPKNGFPDESLEQGRKVYIQEGCVNCHSQFVRPGTKDVELWGPYVEPSDILSGIPPLIGNRRNGPDLLNVGLRRSRQWLALHMVYPQDFTPNSIMPSYAYLFRDGRGEALVSYLQSLGQGRERERFDFINSWAPQAPEVKVRNINASGLYQSNCAQCHGSLGRADGPIASLLRSKPRDLHDKNYLYVHNVSNSLDKKTDRQNQLAKIIKFGIFGTAMPGHEYLLDEEILAIVNFIEGL